MKHITLPHSTVSISPVIVGTWTMGGKNRGHIDFKESHRAIQAALDAGLHTFDTAPAYGSGRAEELLGSIAGQRDDVVIMTKCGLDIDNYFSHNLSPDFLEKELSASLKRLKRDYIDIYICHWPDPQTPVEKTLQKLDQFKKRGLIRAYGLSNFHAEDLDTAVSLGEISLVQMRHSLIFQKHKQDILQCKKNKIPMCAYGTFEGGLLTGKYGESAPLFSKKDARNFFYKTHEHSEEEIQAALFTLKEFSRQKNTARETAGAAWCLNEGLDSVIAGARNEQQIRSLSKLLQKYNY